MVKKLMFALLVISFVMTGVVGAEKTYEVNYIQNGDFEDGMANWKQTWQSGSGTIEIVKDNGNNVIHMQTDNGRCYVIQRVYNTAEGDRLSLSFRLKTLSLAKTSGAVITLSYHDKAEKYITQDNFSFNEIAGDKWVYEKIDFVVPEGTGLMYIMVRLNGVGEIYYDDFEIIDFYNETELTIEKDGMELSSVPEGVGEVTAKLHYVPEEPKESGNIIFAMYENTTEKKLLDVKIQPFKAEGSVFAKATLTVPDIAEGVVLNAYVWKDGQTAVPVKSTTTAPKTGRSSAFDTFLSEKMRGAYGGMSVFYDEAKMQQLEDAGINTFIYNLGGDYGFGDVHKNERALEELCKDVEEYVEESGNRVIIKCCYGANSVNHNTSFGAYHPGEEHALTLPCPLSEEYWNREMLDRYEIIARYPKITGIVFDMEMYSGGRTNFYKPCVCNTCVEKYADVKRKDVAKKLVSTAPEERNWYLCENCILEDYTEWANGEITKITTKLREKIHAINPNLIIGVMPTIEWLAGTTEGLGTEEMPLMIFMEDTYKGVIPITNVKKAYADTNNLNAVFAVGLWASNESAIDSKSFADKIKAAVSHDVGYWIFSVDKMNEDIKFYEELKKANAETTK